MGSQRGKRRTPARPSSSLGSLRKHMYNVSALDGLSAAELKTAKRVAGKPVPKLRKDGATLYKVRTERLASLLEQVDGVDTWNKILSAYKEFAPEAAWELEDRCQRIDRKTNVFVFNSKEIKFVDLDLQDLNLSGMFLKDVRFIRCDLRGSSFKDSRMGESCYEVVFDCCDLEDADFAGALSTQMTNHVRYRTGPQDRMTELKVTQVVPFLKAVGALTAEKRKAEAEERLLEATKREQQLLAGEQSKVSF